MLHGKWHRRIYFFTIFSVSPGIISVPLLDTHVTIPWGVGYPWADSISHTRPMVYEIGTLYLTRVLPGYGARKLVYLTNLMVRRNSCMKIIHKTKTFNTKQHFYQRNRWFYSHEFTCGKPISLSCTLAVLCIFTHNI
jgi:hypothetical protein